ncbi:MAG: hypothetical protein NE327_20810 [Lentisphaeraceae bacterium]|nr:hypothetical protein [Lentisphaeraceae bacterium]
MKKLKTPRTIKVKKGAKVTLLFEDPSITDKDDIKLTSGSTKAGGNFKLVFSKK